METTLRKGALAISLSAAPFPSRCLILFALTIWGDRAHSDRNPTCLPGPLHARFAKRGKLPRIPGKNRGDAAARVIT